MTRPIILTAGKATRAGAHAPDGCKALVRLDDRPVIEWQMDVFGDVEPLIVCREEHQASLYRYGETVVDTRCLGPADSLTFGLARVKADETVVVAYADTFFTELPVGTDWVGTSEAEGGRKWDVIRDGYVAYEHVAEGWTAKVCVGLYAFSDAARLCSVIDRLTVRHALTMPEMGLGPPLNRYAPWREIDIASWKDVGTSEAIEAWSAA
jgi:hypothetical protein